MYMYKNTHGECHVHVRMYMYITPTMYMTMSILHTHVHVYTGADAELNRQGIEAVKSVLKEARKLARSLPPEKRAAIEQMCDEIEALMQELADLQARGLVREREGKREGGAERRGRERVEGGGRGGEKGGREEGIHVHVHYKCMWRCEEGECNEVKGVHECWDRKEGYTNVNGLTVCV